MKGSIRDRYLAILGCAFLFVLLMLLLVNIFRKGIYNSRMGFNLAVVGDRGVNLLLLRPDEELVNWVELPQDVSVKIFNSPASYPLSSLWGFGVGEKKPMEIVEKSLGQSMGVIIARTIKIDKDRPQSEDVLGALLSLETKTDMSIRDRLLVRKFLGDIVKSKKVLELSVPDNSFDKVIDPDGKEYRVFNNTVSVWTRNKFVLEPILDENVDVSVNNVSDIEGIGMSLSHQLESAGVHVVEVKADGSERTGVGGCVYSLVKTAEMTETLLKDQLGCKRLQRNFGEAKNYQMAVWVN